MFPSFWCARQGSTKKKLSMKKYEEELSVSMCQVRSGPMPWIHFRLLLEPGLHAGDLPVTTGPATALLEHRVRGSLLGALWSHLLPSCPWGVEGVASQFPLSKMRIPDTGSHEASGDCF